MLFTAVHALFGNFCDDSYAETIALGMPGCPLVRHEAVTSTNRVPAGGKGLGELSFLGCAP
jgi:hypothetical protein